MGCQTWREQGVKSGSSKNDQVEKYHHLSSWGDFPSWGLGGNMLKERESLKMPEGKEIFEKDQSFLEEVAQRVNAA